KPYDRPVSSARSRMLRPDSYFFFRSAVSLSRCPPLIRAPLTSFSATDPPRCRWTFSTTHDPSHYRFTPLERKIALTSHRNSRRKSRHDGRIPSSAAGRPRARLGGEDRGFFRLDPGVEHPDRGVNGPQGGRVV